MKRSFVVLAGMILTIILTGTTFGLELKEGRMRLALHENTGRFSLFYLSDISENVYTPLFLDQDPRTTFLSILADNRVSVMGDAVGFRQSVAETADGAEFQWESSSLRVTQEFSFLASSGASLADGIKITVTVENISESHMNIGIAQLFDTYLGEEEGLHFTTDALQDVSGETVIESVMPEYWLSPSTEGDWKGFQGMVRGVGLSVPDRLVFANWKRLSDNPWSLVPNTRRNFNLLPYSINDSAVCYFFDPDRVPKNTKLEITLAVGAYSTGGFSTRQVSGHMNELLSKTTETDIAVNDIEESIRADLLTVEDLISQIDRKLKYGVEVSTEELTVMRQVLDRLKQRKSEYGE
jgi:hypothetical protein